MNRLESSGSDDSMGMSFMGKGVNPSYTPILLKDAVTVFELCRGLELQFQGGAVDRPVKVIYRNAIRTPGAKPGGNAG